MQYCPTVKIHRYPTVYILISPQMLSFLHTRPQWQLDVDCLYGLIRGIHIRTTIFIGKDSRCCKGLHILVLPLCKHEGCHNFDSKSKIEMSFKFQLSERMISDSLLMFLGLLRRHLRNRTLFCCFLLNHWRVVFVWSLESLLFELFQPCSKSQQDKATLL